MEETVVQAKSASSVRKRQAKQKDGDFTEEMVQFKFHLIAPAIFETHNMGSNEEYFRSIAGNEYKLPNGSIRGFSVDTFARWTRQYRTEGGMDALRPAIRKDKGTSRKIAPDVGKRIGEIVQAVPKSKATKVLKRLKEDNLIADGDVSVDTVRRFISNNELRNTELAPEHLRNAFIAAHAGDLFVADTCYFEKIDPEEKGAKRPWVFVQGIVDDHSRKKLAAECVMNDTGRNFQNTLRKTIHLYGVPRCLYVDLGSPYIDRELVRACNKLGIELIHAKQGDGASKGVVENKWKLLEDDTIIDIVIDKLNTFEQISTRVEKWRNDYNSSLNSGVGGIPNERWLKSCREKPLRRVTEKELSEAFSVEETRQLSVTGILQLDNIKYKAPDDLRSKVKPRTPLTIVYDPQDREGTIHVLYNGDSYPLTIDDPYENAKTNAARARKEREKQNSLPNEMTVSEKRAETRYRARMAGTDRVDNTESREHSLCIESDGDDEKQDLYNFFFE